MSRPRRATPSVTSTTCDTGCHVHDVRHQVSRPRRATPSVTSTTCDTGCHVHDVRHRVSRPRRATPSVTSTTCDTGCHVQISTSSHSINSHKPCTPTSPTCPHKYINTRNNIHSYNKHKTRYTHTFHYNQFLLRHFKTFRTFLCCKLASTNTCYHVCFTV